MGNNKRKGAASEYKGSLGVCFQILSAKETVVKCSRSEKDQAS